jgi:EAL domain-containing protein (putative c-di-GMP-specific phosphodiesterase class I)
MAANVAPHRLELEVTESLLMEDLEDAAGRLAELKKLGTMICLDHFGTGYSSLTCLRKFSFDKIKIDGSLVAGASDQAAARQTVRAIMALAGTLKIAVASDGVETIDQAEFLRGAGVSLLQGPLFAKPMPLADIAAVAGAGPLAEAFAGEESHVEAVA